MKNAIQRGENLTLPAPYAVTSGGGVKTGLIFGVAAGDAATALHAGKILSSILIDCGGWGRHSVPNRHQANGWEG